MTDMEFLRQLRDILGPEKVLIDDDLASRYDHIWNMDQPLVALAVVLPETTEKLSQVLSLCNCESRPVVIHGGLTNLVGSTETNERELVISMERFNRIEEVDGHSRTITVGAGTVIERIQEEAAQKNLLFPLNFGAKGSAQIGGAISTNAGGLRVLKYGMTRALVLGLEVVLADGTILSSLKKIIKDNSAYDLKQLFIGSEGTLGVVTRAVLKLVERPKSRVSAFVALNEYERVMDFLKYMDARLAGSLSGFELIWKKSYQAMTSAPALTAPPLPQDYNYYVLVEGLGSDQDADQQRLEDLLEQAYRNELILDGVIADGSSDLEWFWKIREDVHVLNNTCTVAQHFDISLPIPMIGRQIASMTMELEKLKGVEQVYAFGHVADGNIHFIVGKESDDAKLTEEVNAIIYGPLKEIGGSVSAEHGIGTHKKKYLKLCRTKTEIKLMKQLKRSLDPKGILNPGKVLDI